MQKKIGVIHATASAIAPLMQAFAKQAPEYLVLNFTNENFFYYAKEQGGVDKKILREFARLVFMAADAGVEAIVVGCSMFCRYVELMQNFLAIPIIAVDDPMMVKAAKTGTKIGVLATNPLTLAPSSAYLRSRAELVGRQITIRELAVPEAGVALKNGHQAEHDRLIAEAGCKLEAAGCDTLVLCQLTMSGAVAKLSKVPVQVLASAEEAVRQVKALCE